MSERGLGLRVSAVLALAVAALIAVVPVTSARGPGAGKKVLIVWGGWEGHQPKQTVDVFAPWLRISGGHGIRRLSASSPTWTRIFGGKLTITR